MRNTSRGGCREIYTNLLDVSNEIDDGTTRAKIPNAPVAAEVAGANK